MKARRINTRQAIERAGAIALVDTMVQESAPADGGHAAA